MTNLNEMIKEYERKMLEDCQAAFGSCYNKHEGVESFINSFDGWRGVYVRYSGHGPLNLSKDA